MVHIIHISVCGSILKIEHSTLDSKTHNCLKNILQLLTHTVISSINKISLAVFITMCIVNWQEVTTMPTKSYKNNNYSL